MDGLVDWYILHHGDKHMERKKKTWLHLRGWLSRPIHSRFNLIRGRAEGRTARWNEGRWSREIGLCLPHNQSICQVCLKHLKSYIEALRTAISFLEHLVFLASCPCYRKLIIILPLFFLTLWFYSCVLESNLSFAFSRGDLFFNFLKKGLKHGKAPIYPSDASSIHPIGSPCPPYPICIVPAPAVARAGGSGAETYVHLTANYYMATHKKLDQVIIKLPR